MASSQVNTNPREALVGWRLHDATAWVLLVLAMGVAIASWLPKDWAAVRTLFQVIGCFAGGMLFCVKAAIWQRTGSEEPFGSTEHLGVGSAREALTGWRHYPAAARVLLAGVGGLAWVPKHWELLRAVMQTLGIFAAGMLAARDAAVWQRSGQVN